MRKSQSSTAEVAAAVRAMHQRERVRIIEDPYAKFLCGRFWQLVLRIRPLEWFIRGVLRPIAPASMCVLMRARYAEQTLETAIEAGITQYVIIGVGMDSFAFRRPDLMDRIDVFEIDHPVTQQKKLEYIRRGGGGQTPPRKIVAPPRYRI
ncbi:MAG: class I SAM-dependent methyltransferase [Truepera sp.]|nr:class I SAM-dependent methyltransferase [Truepera sp.]